MCGILRFGVIGMETCTTPEITQFALSDLNF
jgi:hypothetical protein